MQKYYTDLDDFEDDSRLPLIDWVEWLLIGIFDFAGTVDCGYIGYLIVAAALL